MKRTRIAINGFGRIGRLCFRVASEWPEFDWALVNEVKGGLECAAHLLNFDSLQGRWGREARAEGTSLLVGGQRVAFSEEARLANVPWAEHGIDVVLECSGKFRKPEDFAPYLRCAA